MIIIIITTKTIKKEEGKKMDKYFINTKIETQMDADAKFNGIELVYDPEGRDDWGYCPDCDSYYFGFDSCPCKN